MARTRSETSSGECSGSPRLMHSLTRPKLAQAAPVWLGTMLLWSTHSLRAVRLLVALLLGEVVFDLDATGGQGLDGVRNVAG